jgi:hypothetical protein
MRWRKMISKRRDSRPDLKIKKMNMAKSKRSQVTIFIIIGLVIVALIIGYFLLSQKTEIKINQPSMMDPEQYIDKCAKDAAAQAIAIILPQGGYLAPTNFKLYDDNKVAYFCYTNLFYLTCRMQEPMYFKHLENEITTYSTPKIEECFQSLKLELEKSNYNIEMGNMNLATEVIPNAVRIKINRDFSMEKQGEVRKFESFKTALASPLYKLANVAQEIANQEAKFCHFEYQGFMIFYPEFSIDKKPVGSGKDAAKIYIIQDRDSGKKLNIAIRSCAIPPGF